MERQQTKEYKSAAQGNGGGQCSPDVRAREGHFGQHKGSYRHASCKGKSKESLGDGQTQ